MIDAISANSVIPAKVGIYSILERYKNLMAAVDSKTAAVYAGAPEIPCKNKCYDCCKQLFPVSFVEAFYISEGLKKMERSLRRERSRSAEKISKKIRTQNPLQFEQRGVDKKTALGSHRQFAQFLHAITSDCPALDPTNPGGACTIYELRNHDCRTMGASFDANAQTIVGCFRFAKLGHLIPRMMDFNFRYPEKMALDRALIAEITGSSFTPNVLYYTTMCGPLLKDYAAEDWLKFFVDKGIPAKSESDEYWVVIDV